MSRGPIICLRAIQGVMATANIGLVAYIVNWHLRGKDLTTPSSITFLLFAPIFSILSILYVELAPIFTPALTLPHILILVEAINATFYFAGFIAVAICISDLAFCAGPVCIAGRGVAVLAAAQFSLWMGSAIMVAMDMFKGGKLIKPARARPGMRQVLD